MRKGQKLSDSKNAIYRNKEWFNLQYTILGKTLDEIAMEFNFSSATLYEWLHKHNIKSCHFRGNRTKSFRNKEWLHEQYVILKKTAIDISIESNIGEGTIYYWLYKFGIPMRNRSEIAKMIWQDPKSRPNMISSKPKLAGEKNPMFGKKRSKHSSELASLKLSKDKNPNWRGGVSYGLYCEKFNKKFREYIRNKYNRTCILCDKKEQDNKRKLNVHHIDYNKNSICNGKEWPFIPLCTICHTKTNHYRYKWFNLLINFWLVNPEINLDNDIINNTMLSIGEKCDYSFHY